MQDLPAVILETVSARNQNNPLIKLRCNKSFFLFLLISFFFIISMQYITIMYI